MTTSESRGIDIDEAFGFQLSAPRGRGSVLVPVSRGCLRAADVSRIEPKPKGGTSADQVRST
jgi:hypothetical protein